MHGWDTYQQIIYSFGKCQKFLKDNITAKSYSLWTTLRRFGINLPIRASVNLFISSFRPRLSQKKCIQFYDLFHAFEQRTPNQFCWGTPLFNVRLFIFRFHFFFIIIVIFMHPCFFLRKIIHPSSHPFICRPSLYHLSVTCSSLL